MTHKDRRARDLDEFPQRMFAHHMAEWLGVSLKAFYRQHEHGQFVFAEHRPRIGKLSWSRERLRQWDAGELSGLTGRKSTVSLKEKSA